MWFLGQIAVVVLDSRLALVCASAEGVGLCGDAVGRVYLAVLVAGNRYALWCADTVVVQAAWNTHFRSGFVAIGVRRLWLAVFGASAPIIGLAW